MATTYNQAGTTYNQAGLTYQGFPVVSEGDALKLLNENLVEIGELPDFEDLEFKDTLNEETAWTFKYDRSGLNFASMISAKDRFFSVPLPGGGRYLGYIEENSYDLVNQQDTKVEFSGRGLEGLLEYAKVIPNESGVSVYPFTSQTVGHILVTLIGQAKGRGAIPQIQVGFTEISDSSGTVWPSTVTVDIRAGSSILDVLKGFAEQGWLDWRITGSMLQLYIVNTTMATDHPDVIFRRGIHIQTSPVKRSRKDLANAIIGVGDDDQWALAEDATSIAANGRKEGYFSFSGVGAPALQGLIQSKLVTTKLIRESNTMTVYYKSIQPFNHFRAGDFVYADLDDTGLKQFRVIDFSYTTFPEPMGEISLNDRFDELEVQMQDKIDAILAGASGTSTPVTPGTATTQGTPVAPTGVGFTSLTYQSDQDGLFYAGVSISWSPVTLNTNGAPSDIDSYEVQHRYAATIPWATAFGVTDSSLFINGLIPGKTLEVRVRAKSKSGKLSAYSSIFAGVLEEDTIPPDMPSLPTTEGILGTITLLWDGLTYAGNEMPIDFKEARIYQAPSPNADPVSSIIAGTFGRGGGILVINNTAYNDTVYFRLSAIDFAGNESDLTDSVEGIATRIAGPDLEANTITANELAVGSVTAQAIDVAAINANTAMFGASANLIPDPSFGDSAYRTKRLTFADVPARWQYSTFSPLTGSAHYLEGFGHASDATTGKLPLTGWFGVHPGEKFYFKTWARKWTDANAGAGFRVGFELMDANGSTGMSAEKYTFSNTAWTKYEHSYRVGEGWVQARVIVFSVDHTAGSVFWDEVECRNFIGGSNAIGSRVEVSPLGIFMWDGNDEKTIDADAVTGNLTVRGQLQSGFTAKRLIINPTTTYLPEIRLYPDEGNAYAYINAVGTSTVPFLGMNAPDSGGPPARGFKVILADNNMWLGEFEINTLTSTGTAIVGDAGDGYLWFVGKMPGAALNSRSLFTGGNLSTLNGVGSANGDTTLTVSKPTTSGNSYPICTLLRITNTYFDWHLNGNDASSWAIRWHNHTVDNVTTYTDYILFRGDAL